MADRNPYLITGVSRATEVDAKNPVWKGRCPSHLQFAGLGLGLGVGIGVGLGLKVHETSEARTKIAASEATPRSIL